MNSKDRIIALGAVCLLCLLLANFAVAWNAQTATAQAVTPVPQPSPPVGALPASGWREVRTESAHYYYHDDQSGLITGVSGCNGSDLPVGEAVPAAVGNAMAGAGLH